VNVQLIDARADAHLWGKGYDRTYKDVLGVRWFRRNCGCAASEKLFQVNPFLWPQLGHATPKLTIFLRGGMSFTKPKHDDENTYDRADGFYRQALAQDQTLPRLLRSSRAVGSRQHWFISPLAPGVGSKVAY
jgi:hypothetical protein